MSRPFAEAPSDRHAASPAGPKPASDPGPGAAADAGLPRVAGPGAQPLILHASCIALADRGLLILGPSGAGKSTLAIQMIARGARLVSDDRTAVTAEAGRLWASCPAPAIRGLVEARGLGLLRAPLQDRAALVLVIDLGQDETERLPPPRSTVIAQCELPLVLRPQNPHLADALCLYLQGGRQE